MMKYCSAALLCAVLGMPEMAAQDQQEPFIPITDEMLLNPDPKDWLMHYRTFDFSGYSPLDQINGSNVDRLQLAWMRAMDAGGQEIRPLVYEGIMYVAHAGSDHLQAWDATTGDLIWDYKRELPGNILDYRTSGARTRNLAMYDDKVYHLTRDTYLIALHARTGALVWETQISELEDGIAHSSGAVVVKGKVLAGRTCSMRSGLRCFISAHDALTGKELWRTHTTPAQGEPGSESWGICPPRSESMSLPGEHPGATIRSWISSTGAWRCRVPIPASFAAATGMWGTRRPVSSTPTPPWPWTPTAGRSSGTTSTFPAMSGMPISFRSEP